MRIIALCRCLGYLKGEREFCDFHFKGVFYGRKIEKIRVKGREIFFEEGVDYILDLTFVEFLRGILLARVERWRKIWN